MLSALLRRRRRLLPVLALVVLALLAATAVLAFGGSADVVVYNGRSQYGDEATFKLFEKKSGKTLELRGGTAPELFERLEPRAFRDPDGDWWGLSKRIRTPMRSTERVPASAIRHYEDLGKPRFKG